MRARSEAPMPNSPPSCRSWIKSGTCAGLSRSFAITSHSWVKVSLSSAVKVPIFSHIGAYSSQTSLAPLLSFEGFRTRSRMALATCAGSRSGGIS